MKILLVSDLHYFEPWFDWLKYRAPDHDLLVLAGDLLDQDHPTPHLKQVSRVSAWIRNWPGPLFICSGNHDRTWNSASNCWDPASWLEELSRHNCWTRSGIVTFDGISFLQCNFREPIPSGRADIWITHNPPAGTAVGQSPTDREEGDSDLTEAIKQRGPKLLLCGHQHTPACWRATLHNTLCLNPGMNPGVQAPNYILIDTDRSTAQWQTGDPHSVFTEKLDISPLHRPRRSLPRTRRNTARAPYLTNALQANS